MVKSGVTSVIFVCKSEGNSEMRWNYDISLTNGGKSSSNFSRDNLSDMIDETTLLAASVPVLLFMGIVGYLVYSWKKNRHFF